MTAVKQSGTKGALYDEQSEVESDSTNEDESQTSEDSGSDSGSIMKTDDDEDIYFHRPSDRFSNSRSWWKEDFRPKIFRFQSNNCGIDVDLNDDSPLDFFKLFFDQEVIQIIVNETNQFQASASGACESSLSHQAKWSPTDSQEIYLFLTTFMLMAHVRKHRIKDYWSTDHLIATPMVHDIMPRDRFLLILKFLHFNDNSSQSEGDRLHKIRPIIQHLKEKFGSTLVPYQNLCIDESMMLWKGRLQFKQYIPTKRHKYGVKFFVLCDCRTGFVLDFIIYTGSETDIVYNRKLGMAGSVVMRLMQPYLLKGHNLFMDSWFTSPILFEELHANSTGACGTVRENRSGMPEFTDQLEKGDYDYRHPDTLLAIKWFDKRQVLVLSTIHEARLGNTGKLHWQTRTQIRKPISVIDYNKNRGSVDKSDMQISCVEAARKSVKWYKKLFFRLLDISVLNSYILYKEKTGRSTQFHEFRLELIRQIVATYSKAKAARGQPSGVDNPVRLVAHHFPTLIPSTSTKPDPRKQCVVCANTTKRAKKRAESRYECADCNVGLCILDCFRDYHTLKCF